LIGEALAITREALTNVERHAEAPSATIRVRSVAGEIRISVEDDGVGAGDNPPAWTIASRVRDLAGRVAITAASAAGGTRLAVVLPGTVTRHPH
jgi:signal transduction histidine kinase